MSMPRKTGDRKKEELGEGEQNEESWEGASSFHEYSKEGAPQFIPLSSKNKFSSLECRSEEKSYIQGLPKAGISSNVDRY
ncbi:hypothetical protein L2E82_36185 [Cichorium intybus]|uniref:Uncharacterized protein n=1 Tax=Cichorium intybus TaxID=13427 RepID=A0ACB9BQX8_CICIN|nr:hypothetical protein L2E82_36185 [Cichorium intybus]